MGEQYTKIIYGPSFENYDDLLEAWEKVKNASGVTLKDSTYFFRDLSLEASYQADPPHFGLCLDILDNCGTWVYDQKEIDKVKKAWAHLLLKIDFDLPDPQLIISHDE